MNKLKDKKIQDQDSEVEEDDQDFDLSQKIQQKQAEIEELSKKIRYMDLDFKKKEIEMNAQLANEKQRVEELQDILQKKLADIKENKEADELQKRLTIVEDELFEKQQIAHEMLRQLTDMEQENEYLKSEVERLSSSSPQKNQNEDIDVDKIVSTCMELQKRNDELQTEVEQIKRGAIDTIVEKEKIIIELQEQLDGLTYNMQNMDQNMMNTNNEIHQEEIESIRREYDQRIQFLEERCMDLAQRLEQDQLQHEEQLMNLEQQITERVLENMQQHIDSAKSVEADLMQQLQIVEEKLRNQEKYLSDSQKLLQNTREEFRKEREQYEVKIRNLTKQAEQLDEVSRQLKQVSKEFDDYRKQTERDNTEKLISLEKLQQKRDELMKVQINLDSENKRLKENLENSKQTIRNLEEQNDQLQEKIDESSRDIHYRIKEITERYEKEKTVLEQELRNQGDRIRKYSSHSNNGAIKSTPSQEILRQVTPQQIRKDSQNLEKIEHLHSSNQVQSFNQEAQDANSKESSSRKSNASAPRTSNPKQTQLGFEFEDEDFSIEEEKTDKLEKANLNSEQNGYQEKSQEILDQDLSPNNYESQNSIGDLPEQKLSIQSSSSNQNRRKKESFNITEASINPLQPQRNSARNQFKKQFMFPQQNQTNNSPQRDTLTYDQIARGYNIENINIQDLVNENIDLKLRNQKLECSINGLEVTIEKLQNEAKQTLKQLQEVRKEKVLTNKEADLINELNSFKAHCHRVETQFVTQKLQLTEELHFYKEEVRVLEKIANENREQMLKLSQDKDYFQQKYTKLKNILKQRRTGGSVGGNSVFADNYEVGVQQSQKKKTFWIFK
ncbi:hypothetical protein TTHERM_01094820 (macronuclear) [Tetrahymena thermophila SB210]|uniref:Uncharacterized protein n=1 Tax=Tetrahymena thermophila (strain SB210) TaxID=312017 RepID=Q22ZH8_TETTS|nr:hypothetical protein TTHERM_01094820 [Tetrahymena thermophila SB210]EAR90669.2 hypothetical protein TTHERM_01094820 [Tetrahymena thermophila SB210]|eukprot:XP_001010914.2 hypothetical protein TTHERM_01094820 [Tetrahymena thermophila SB210]